jgi:hypothetical protein
VARPGEVEGLSHSTDALASRGLVWWIIGFATLARLVLAGAIGLGVDEAYMVSTARRLSLSYFDHPPLAWWITHASVALFGSESHLAVRLPFVLLFAVTTWLIFRMTANVFGEREGVVAVLFLTISPVFSVSSGSWVLPDGPLLCALAAAGYCLSRVLLEPAPQVNAWSWWLAGGAATGAALLSKYQAVLFVAGAFLFLLVRPAQRRWLTRPEPYAACAIAGMLFVPVLVWNGRHAWVSFAFQLGRASSSHPVHVAERLAALGRNLIGQAAWVLPWIWLPLIAVLLGAFRRRPADDRYGFFAWLAVVPVALFTAASLGGQPGLPHWPASGYLFLFPLLGAAVIERADSASHIRQLRFWAASSIVAFGVLVVLAASAAITGWTARVLRGSPSVRDPTLESVDWNELPRGLDSLGVLHLPHSFVAAPSWVQAGKASYALGPDVTVLCLSVDPHQFAFMDDQRDFLGQDAVIVVRLPAPRDVIARFPPYFESVTWLGSVTIRRIGVPVFDIGVFLGHNFERPMPASALPVGARAAGPSRAGADYLPPVLVGS